MIISRCKYIPCTGLEVSEIGVEIAARLHVVVDPRLRRALAVDTVQEAQEGLVLLVRDARVLVVIILVRSNGGAFRSL